MNFFAKNTLSAVVVIFTLLFITMDIKSRLVINANQDEHAANNVDIVPLNFPTLFTETLVQLTQTFEKYKAETTADNESSVTLSLLEQAMQQGELDRVFAGEFELTLKAVISEQEKYALLEQKNNKTADTRLVKCIEGADILGYTLTIGSNTHVKLVNNNQHIDLMMYKKINK